MNATPSPTTQPLLYTRQEAAAQLAISLRTLDELTASKRLKFARIGRSIRFRPAWLEEFIEEQASPARRR